MCECTRLYCTVVRNGKYMCELCAYPLLTMETKKKLLGHPVSNTLLQGFEHLQGIDSNVDEKFTRFRRNDDGTYPKLTLDDNNGKTT